MPKENLVQINQDVLSDAVYQAADVIKTASHFIETVRRAVREYSDTQILGLLKGLCPVYGEFDSEIEDSLNNLRNLLNVA